MAEFVKPVKNIIRGRITPRYTDMLSGLGYVNRNNLAAALHQIKPHDQSEVIKLLHDRGILKSRFNPISADEIQPFMIKAVEQTTVQELFVGSDLALRNIADGIEAGYQMLATEIQVEKPFLPAFKIATLLGTIAAAGIGATVIGLPAVAGFGGCVAYGVVSKIMIRGSEPHSTAGRIFAYGTRVLPVATAAFIAANVYMTAIYNNMFLDALSFFISPKFIVPALATGLGVTAVLTKRDIDRASEKHGAAGILPHTKSYIKKAMAYSNLKIFSGTNYMGYRIITYLAFGGGVASQYFFAGAISPWLIAGTASGIAVRLLMDGVWRYRKAEGCANQIKKAYAWMDSKKVDLGGGKKAVLLGEKSSDGEVVITLTIIKISANGQEVVEEIKVFKAGNPEKMTKDITDHIRIDGRYKGAISPIESAAKAVFLRTKLFYFSPIVKLSTEYIASLVMNYGALLAFTLPFVSSPTDLLYKYASLYLGAWTLNADFQAQLASIVSALNYKRSTFNLEVPHISDADRGRMGRENQTVRLQAYIKEPERNFAKLVNTLLIDFPHLEIEWCSETPPLGSLGAMRALNGAREISEIMRNWRDENYNRFHAGYVAFQGAVSVRDEANKLADLLDGTGDLYFNSDDPDSYIARLKRMLKQDERDHPDIIQLDGTAVTHPDRLFDLTAEETYVRQAYEAIRAKGYRLKEKARSLRASANFGGQLSMDDIRASYMEMLGVFSVNSNHVPRKLAFTDDNIATKIFNLASTQVHLGDTLYMVWRLVTRNGKPNFEPEYVPATYVRIKNPYYNHLEGEGKENRKYLWISRETFYDVLGISQSMSQDLKLVDVIPEGIQDDKIKVKVGSKTLTVCGYYSDREFLKPRKLINWEGQEVDQDNLTCIAEGDISAEFDRTFREYAREQYDKVRIDYKTADGRNFSIKFGKKILINGDQNADWANIAYGLIKTDDQGNSYIEAHAADNQLIGIVDGAWPKGMHPAEDVKIDKRTGHPRVEFFIESYDKWSRENGNKLWFIDKPEVLVLSPTVNYAITDEGYIVFDTERVLGSELRHTEVKDKTLRAVNYEEKIADLPNPGYQVDEGGKAHVRDIRKVLRWDKYDAEIGVRYKVIDGDDKGIEFNIPFAESRQLFVKNISEDAWRQISYGLIKKDQDGKTYIEVYSKENRSLGTVKTELPAPMHDPAVIKDGRIEFDVFPERIGRATWLVADYGSNYGTEGYKRFRCVRLDFDREAKQEFWPNFITSLEASGDRSKVKFTTISVKCDTFPFDKKWANVRMAEEVSVLEVDGSGRGYIDPAHHTWSPGIDADHIREVKGGIVLVRGEDGRDRVFSVDELPSSLSDEREARKVIRVEVSSDGKELVFVKLRRKSKIKDDPSFIYSLDGSKIAGNMDYEKLKLILDKFNLTVKFAQKPDGTFQDEAILIDENNKDTGIKLRLSDLEDNNGNGFLKNKRFHMSSPDSFYWSKNCTYRGTEEYRPKLIKIDGEVKLILTRVEDKDKTRIEMDKNNEILAALEGMKDPDIFFALPSSGAKIKRVMVTKADLACFGERADALWDDLVNAGYINDDGRILAKFDGKPENFSPGSRVSEEDKKKLFDVLRRSQVEKWVPLSFTRPITYKPTANVGRVAVTVKEGGEDKTLYFSMPVTKDLPERTLSIRYDRRNDGKYYAHSMKPSREPNSNIAFHDERLGEVGPGVAAQVDELLSKENIDKNGVSAISIEVFHTRGVEVIDGEYHSVVHGQRQQGASFRDEMYPATDLAELRDELFYGVVSELFSEIFPHGSEPRSHGIQLGKDLDYDMNDMFCGSAIENGSPFMDRHNHLFEMVEVTLGLPKGSLIAFAPVLDRCGGYERVMHKPHYAKLVLYCREKGWLNGVSEDEQGKLALALALGYTLKYHIRVTAFDSQPNTLSQVMKQEFARYNTAMALAIDVLIPHEARQLIKWLSGIMPTATFKHLLESLCFWLWYKWPFGKMAREFSPPVTLGSGSKITPYMVDSYFIFAYLFDAAADLYVTSSIRKGLGRTKDRTGYRPMWWTFIRSSVMNQAAIFPALKGAHELAMNGWQYAPFAVTALQ